MAECSKAQKLASPNKMVIGFSNQNQYHYASKIQTERGKKSFFREKLWKSFQFPNWALSWFVVGTLKNYSCRKGWEVIWARKRSNARALELLWCDDEAKVFQCSKLSFVKLWKASFTSFVSCFKPLSGLVLSSEGVKSLLLLPKCVFTTSHDYQQNRLQPIFWLRATLDYRLGHL